MRLHTDREILRCIFDTHAKQYPAAEGDPLVPVDVADVAKKLNCSHELLSGRLFHDMAHRFSYVEERGDIRVAAHLFLTAPRRVNFPLLAATLAGLEAEHRRNTRATRIALAALLISVVSAAAACLVAAPKLLSLAALADSEVIAPAPALSPSRSIGPPPAAAPEEPTTPPP